MRINGHLYCKVCPVVVELIRRKEKNEKLEKSQKFNFVESEKFIKFKEQLKVL